MSANVDAMVRAGVDAYRAGNKTEARTLLERAIEIDGYNETAWLWLSAVVETAEEQQTCLENVLIINPVNKRARQGLKSLGIDPDSIGEENTSAPAFEEGSFDEYSVPSSSSSVEYSGPVTSSDQYDDWVDGLNINATNEVAKEPAVSDDLFGEIDFSDAGGSFDLDDNLFNDDAYGGYEEDALFDDAEETYFEGNVFGGNVFEDDALFDDGDELFADIGTLEDFNDAVGGTDDYNDSAFAEDPFAPPPPEPAESVAVSDEATLFALIPAEIKATRAPGVSESAPVMHYIIIAVLLLINIGGLFFVSTQFLG